MKQISVHKLFILSSAVILLLSACGTNESGAAQPTFEETATFSHTGSAAAVHMQLKASGTNTIVCQVSNTPASTRPMAENCPSGTYTEQLFGADWKQIGLNKTVTVSGSSAPSQPFERFTEQAWQTYDGAPARTVSDHRMTQQGTLDDGSKLALNHDLTTQPHVSFWAQGKAFVVYFKVEDAQEGTHFIAVSNKTYAERTDPSGGFIHVDDEQALGKPWRVDLVAHLQRTKGVKASRIREVNIRGAMTFGDLYFGADMLLSKLVKPSTPAPPTPGHSYPPEVSWGTRGGNITYPGYLAAQPASVQDMTITRITDNASSNDNLKKHQYSRRAAWNRDGSLILISNNILDAKTYKKVTSTPMSDENWSNTNPDILFGTQGNRFLSHNVRTDKVTTLHTFSGYGDCTIGQHEGNVTLDDEKVLLDCKQSGSTTLISYDIQNDRVLGTKRAACDYNWASFSPLGTYILTENNSKNGCSSKKQLRRSAPDFSQDTLLTNDRRHGDLGLDAQGREVFVMISWDYVSYIDIANKSRVRLGFSSPQNGSGHGHISCRNFGRPGWCYITSYRGDVGAVKLGIADSTPIGKTDIDTPLYQGVSGWELWGEARTTREYDAQGKGSVSWDGTRIVVTSNWNDTKPINDYVFSYAQ